MNSTPQPLENNPPPPPPSLHFTPISLSSQRPCPHGGYALSYKLIAIQDAEKRRIGDSYDFRALEQKAELNLKWRNRRFPSATFVGNKWGLMPMERCLGLVVTAISQFAGLVLIMKSVRVAERAWVVALPMKVKPFNFYYIFLVKLLCPKLFTQILILSIFFFE